MKKLIAIAAVVLLVTFSATSALAHGGCRGGARTVSYAVCSTESCTLEGLHTHRGRTFTAHYYGDGHTYHSYCTLENCTFDGYHEHDGEYCFAHTVNDGHAYHQAGRRHH